LLIEAGLRGLVDKLVVVKIERKVHLARILKKRRLSKSEILKRIRAQISLEDKVRLADFIIDNSGAIEQTKKQARKIRRQLWKN
jgi:dephospho-CoA kinase